MRFRQARLRIGSLFGKITSREHGHIEISCRFGSGISGTGNYDAENRTPKNGNMWRTTECVTAMSSAQKTGSIRANSMFSTGTTNLSGGRSRATPSDDVKARGARPSISKARLIAAKSFFQPAFELTKEEPEVGSRRLLEKFDNARTQILSGVINRSEQTHIGP